MLFRAYETARPAVVERVSLNYQSGVRREMLTGNNETRNDKATKIVHTHDLDST